MSTKTILLDLDNTLLGNNMNDFLPPYFASLEKRLQSITHKQNIRQLMMASAQTIQDNQDTNQTNMQVFQTKFAQRLNVSVATLLYVSP